MRTATVARATADTRGRSKYPTATSMWKTPAGQRRIESKAMTTWGMLAFGLLIAAVLIGYYANHEAEKRAKIEGAKYKDELEAEGAKARADMAAEGANLAERVKQHGTIAEQVEMEELDRLTPEQRARL